jgi:ribonucleoside-diphosphate reductase alpha chain
MQQKEIDKLYSTFIAKRTYARWIDELKQRESWADSTNRYYDYVDGHVPASLKEEMQRARGLTLSFGVMPSMRGLWSAGPAMEDNNFAMYNCAYLAMDEVDKFSEMLYVLMHGTGVGFSVERQYVVQLPEVPEIPFLPSGQTYVVQDSKLGWMEAYQHCVTALYRGLVPKFDFSQVRPKGARLKTFGGRASGPEPLKQLFDFTARVFQNAQGRKLNSLEVHDICCMIANCVVVGGVRRSACVSFSNLSDQRLQHAKDGQFWLDNPQRAMANNSVAYTEKPDSAIFLGEWLNLLRSGSGERGIFNAQAARKKADAMGRSAGDVRANPCVEALLKDRQLCNLTEVVVRPADTVDTLKEKIRAAVLVGCVQATYTYFPNVSAKWKENAEEERLIGVSLTGTCDSPLLRKVNDNTRELLTNLKQYAHECTKEFAEALGINVPKQVTLTKPSGTVSQLVNSASGLHPRYADYYIRRVRVNAKDPIARLLMDKGVAWNPEVGQSLDDYNTVVFDFPMKSPRGSVNRHMWSALEQLEYWKMFNQYWCDGNPSVTIYVKEDEWVGVGAWVYANWSQVCGLSFLPHDGGNYQLAPYEELTADEYHAAVKAFARVKVDLDAELNAYEQEDHTEGAKTYACTGGSCEL